MTSYQVGDPDPTADILNPDCPAQVQMTLGGTYVCTWEKDHNEPHVAGMDGVIVAVWDA